MKQQDLGPSPLQHKPPMAWEGATAVAAQKGVYSFSVHRLTVRKASNGAGASL